MTKPTAAQLRAALREHMKRLASKGGKRGGKARMAQLTPEERSALGRKAVLARWTKERKPKAKRHR